MGKKDLSTLMLTYEISQSEISNPRGVLCEIYQIIVWINKETKQVKYFLEVGLFLTPRTTSVEFVMK